MRIDQASSACYEKIWLNAVAEASSGAIVILMVLISCAGTQLAMRSPQMTRDARAVINVLSPSD